MALLLAASVAWAVPSGSAAPNAGTPVFVTTAGQSADAHAVKLLLDRSKIASGYDAVAEADKISGSKTLFLVMGGSSKGLGAAGLSLEQDMDRVKNLIAEAKKQGAKIISMHTGGAARRGEASNQVIALCVPFSDAVIVVEGGNADGFFTGLCEKAGVPLIQVASIAEAGSVLKSLVAQQ
jgi:hypothetical protein